MPDTLLGLVLDRLDQIETPVLAHREITSFSTGDVGQLLASGVLRETAQATEIPRPARFPSGPDLVVRRTERGLFGVAAEDDYFAPLELVEDDVRQYEISVTKLAGEICRENGMDPGVPQHNDGLLTVGQKPMDGYGGLDVFLSCPNLHEEDLISRCRRLRSSSCSERVVVLTPRAVSLAPEKREAMAGMGVLLISLHASAATGSLSLPWGQITNRLGVDSTAHDFVFQNEGRTWLVVYDGVRKSVPDQKGMEYIAYLLNNPGHEFPALTLRRLIDGVQVVEGSAGEMADNRALGDYRREYREIEMDLEQARADNDLGREQQLSEKREALTVEIGRATGLGGRKRQAGDPQERARSAISKSIRRALDAIEPIHEPCALHLRNFLKIRTSLAYTPDQPITWRT